MARCQVCRGTGWRRTMTIDTATGRFVVATVACPACIGGVVSCCDEAGAEGAVFPAQDPDQEKWPNSTSR